MIVVLSAAVSDELLREVLGTVERLGWSAQVSRGSEQTVVALEGNGDPDELGAALASSSGELDLIPIHTARHYQLRRSRRTLLTGLATGLGLLTAVGAGIPVVGFLLPPSGSLTDPDVASGGAAESLEPGTARTMFLRGQPVLLICLEPDRYVALGAACTHMQTCRLEWDREHRILVCPCHGGAFDIYGNVLRGPASVPLPSYSVERVGGELFVRRS